jgi:hypothetical protein
LLALWAAAPRCKHLNKSRFAVGDNSQLFWLTIC